MRAVVHLAAGLALAALAFALGRWLRDPQPGGPLIALLAAVGLYALALRRLYSLGGPYRSVRDLVRVAGFGPSRVRGLGGRVRV